MLPLSSAACAASPAGTAGPESSVTVADQLDAICQAAKDGLSDSELACRLAQVDDGQPWIARLWVTPEARDAWFDTVSKLRQDGRLQREFKELLRAPLTDKIEDYDVGDVKLSPYREEYPLFHHLMGLHPDSAALYLRVLLDAAGREWLSDKDLIDLAQGNATDIPLSENKDGTVKRPLVYPGALNYAVQNGNFENVTAFMTFLLDALDRRLLTPSQALKLATSTPTGRIDAVERNHRVTLSALDGGIAQLKALAGGADSVASLKPPIRIDSLR